MKINQISDKSIETLIGKVKNEKTRKWFNDNLDKIILNEFKTRKLTKGWNKKIIDMYLNATTEVRDCEKLFRDQYELIFEQSLARLELIKGINIVLKSQK